MRNLTLYSVATITLSAWLASTPKPARAGKLAELRAQADGHDNDDSDKKDERKKNKGKLDQVRDNANRNRTPPSQPTPPRAQPAPHHRYHDDDDETVIVVRESPPVSYYGGPVYYSSEPSYVGVRPEPRPVDVTLRLSGDYSYQADGIQRFAGSLVLSGRYVGLSTNWAAFAEPTIAAPPDTLTLGNVNLQLTLAKTERVQAHVGLGVRMMIDQGVLTHAGANLLFGVDARPSDLFIVSGSLSTGNLGEALVTEVRLTAGLDLRPVELFAGWDGLRVGDVALSGPVVGVRLWL